MKVTLLSELSRDFIEESIDKMYVAARTCYSANTCADLIDDACNRKTIPQKIELISKVLESGHHSIAEHVNISFTIDSISRSCSHQLIRHRLCTYSQQSQRYVNFSNKSFNYVIPPDIAQTFSTSNDLCRKYVDLMTKIKEFYDDAVEAGIKAEDARYVLPNAACTNIVVTTNLRNLIHILGLRCCTRAQWEIRAVYRELSKQLKHAFPFIEKYLDANCVQLGYCPEGHKSCGRFPSLKELQK